jgi:hypothetical protein
MKFRTSCVISKMKPTWCTFRSIYWESKASTCFEHYLLILRRCCTNGCGTVAVSLQSWHSQLTLYARNIPNAFSGAPPEDEQVILETCRSLWFSINWKKSASRWFQYTDILWCTVSKTLYHASSWYFLTYFYRRCWHGRLANLCGLSDIRHTTWNISTMLNIAYLSGQNE